MSRFFLFVCEFPLSRFAVLSLCLLTALPQLAHATRTIDTRRNFEIDLPAGWRATLAGGKPSRVTAAYIPRRKTDADRGRARIQVEIRRLPGKKALAAEIARLRQGDKGTAPARRFRQWAPHGRPLTQIEYRDGSYDAGGAWLVSRYVLVYLPVDRKTLLVARCSAAETEFEKYRRVLEKSCLSLAPAAR